MRGGEGSPRRPCRGRRAARCSQPRREAATPAGSGHGCPTRCGVAPPSPAHAFAKTPSACERETGRPSFRPWNRERYCMSSGPDIGEMPPECGRPDGGAAGGVVGAAGAVAGGEAGAPNAASNPSASKEETAPPKPPAAPPAAPPSPKLVAKPPASNPPPWHAGVAIPPPIPQSKPPWAGAGANSAPKEAAAPNPAAPPKSAPKPPPEAYGGVAAR